MSTNKTPNLNLHSWVETDPVLMSEFNENFGAIDGAIADGVKIRTGSYVGTGVFGTNNPNLLLFDFTPKIVFIHTSPYYGYTYFHNNASYFSAYNQVFYYEGTKFYVASNEGTGGVEYSLYNNSLEWFSSTAAGNQMNKNGTTYSYIAIG